MWVGAVKAVAASVAVGAAILRWILLLQRQLYQTSASVKKFFGDGNGDGNAAVRESRQCE